MDYSKYSDGKGLLGGKNMVKVQGKNLNREGKEKITLSFVSFCVTNSTKIPGAAFMDASAYLCRFVCLSLFYGQLVLFIIKQIRIQPFCYAT